MKNTIIKQLDDKDEEIADALMAVGMGRNIARTLSYLHNVDEATSVELEKVVRLHQPEVSIAMKQLKERDWINEREKKKTGKGRPYKVYSLKVAFNDIIAQLEKQQKKSVDDTQTKIEKLKELGGI